MKRILSIVQLMVLLLITATGISVAQERFGGATLYTVRDQMAKAPMETLKAVADAGYKYIEVADYKDGKFYGMTPAELKTAFDELGLEPLSAHMSMVTLENADQLIADVKAAGFRYFVIPVPPMGYFTFNRETGMPGMKNDLEGLKEILMTLAQKCKAGGVEMIYHNHNMEFEKNEDGIVPIEYLLENFDPSLMNFEIDLYWATKAGADPVAYFEKYPGRWTIWHMKDMDDQGRFAPVGNGTIDFGNLLKLRKKAGMEYYIVEQDRTFDGMDPLEAIRISHEGLKKFGYDKY